VLDGEIRLTVEGDEYAYRQGDICDARRAPPC
jgi:quercetin dioxygenase-like cupin family protein